jgi:hypothetical protein
MGVLAQLIGSVTSSMASEVEYDNPVDVRVSICVAFVMLMVRDCRDARKETVMLVAGDRKKNCCERGHA